MSEANPSLFRYDVVRKAALADGEVSNSRWTTESIEAKLDEITRETGGKIPVNIWVCGTPSMNETFEKAFTELKARGKISTITSAQVI